MVNKKILKNLVSIFHFYPKIKLVYFFGSQVSKETGPLSDYDFAFYLDSRDEKAMFEIKLDLFNKISHLLKTDKIDIVILNTLKSSEFKYNIIASGNLIYSQEPFQVLVEPKILNEYFDFRLSLLKYNLTKASI